VAPFVSWTVRSQPGALRRIVMNLLGNALKYTESGYIAIKLQQSTKHHEAIDLALSIEDSGRGMTAEYQRTKLFSPFSQEDPFSSGTGLGLSIVKQIIESLKGEIEVNSTLNVGTQIKVSVRLPVAQSNSTEQDQALRASKELTGLSAGIVTETDTYGGERGVKLKESMQGACQGFHMKIHSSSVDQISGAVDVSIADLDVLLTDSASLTKMLEKPGMGRINMPPLSVVCICTDTAEKTAVDGKLLQKMDQLGWVVEVVTQP
jgi:hypothetical protein